MESGVVEILGSPEFINSEIGVDLTFSERVKIIKNFKGKITNFKKCL